MELLVVIALIAGLTALLVQNSAGGESARRQSARGAVAGLLAVARIKAASSGEGSRVLVNIDPSATNESARFLRYLVVQVRIPGGWRTVMDLHLPDGAYIVPGDFTPLPGGLFHEGVDAWMRVDGVTRLRSTMLRSSQILTEMINSTVAEDWVSVTIGAAGTTSQSGDLVMASGRPRPPGSYSEGESPVELVNPENTCGLTLSSYGLTVLIPDRASF